jgi:hypothetical protein
VIVSSAGNSLTFFSTNVLTSTAFGKKNAAQSMGPNENGKEQEDNYSIKGRTVQANAPVYIF